MSQFLPAVFCLLALSHVLLLKVFSQQIPDEKWKYVKVRENAFMFWWLYGAAEDRVSKPLVMWVQGGPGGSGTGFGNFMEIGPSDINGKEREFTWLKAANVLFVDNPVGTGFSYVTDKKAYTTNVTGISTDLLTMFKSFLNDMPVFKTIPFYIFCESYGGKMTSAFGVTLQRAIQDGELECNFKGVALGDSWISPVDTVLTWGPYLYAVTLLDHIDLAAVNNIANQTAKAFYDGDYAQATSLWNELEVEIASRTDNVNVYNILQHNVQSPFKETGELVVDATRDISQLYWQHVGRLQEQSLAEFMNGPVRKKLGIIPANVTWGGQSEGVFANQYVDFMKPVVKDVSKLLNYGLNVAIYQGQLDMICDTMGAEVWVMKLSWPHLGDYLKQKKTPLYAPSKAKVKATGGFVKELDNLQFYYVMNAGHMVPADTPEMALAMMERILGKGTLDNKI